MNIIGMPFSFVLRTDWDSLKPVSVAWPESRRQNRDAPKNTAGHAGNLKRIIGNRGCYAPNLPNRPACAKAMGIK